MADKTSTKSKQATGKTVAKPTVITTTKAKAPHTEPSKAQAGVLKKVRQKREELDIHHFLDLLFELRQRTLELERVGNAGGHRSGVDSTHLGAIQSRTKGFPRAGAGARPSRVRRP